MRLGMVLFVCGLGLYAQAPVQKGQRVIDDCVRALGGDRFLALKNRVEVGRAYSFYREQLTGLAIAKIYTQYLDPQQVSGTAAVRQQERQVFGKKEDSVVLFTGQDGYRVTFRGVKPLPDAEVERHQESTRYNIFYILRERRSEPGLTFDYKDSAVEDNRPVDHIEIIDADNRRVLVSFDQGSHLPVKQVYQRRDPATKDRIEETTLFAKYRDIGQGVQWPFNVLRQRNGEKVFELFAESVEINQALDQQLFALPKDSKILKREAN